MPFLSSRKDHCLSSLEKLDQTTLRYRRQEVVYNQHYQDLCQRNDRFHCYPFQATANYHCLYIHQQTSMSILHHLIDVVCQTHWFTIDVQQHIEPYPWAQNPIPALIVVQCHLTRHRTTPLVIVIEVLHIQSNRCLSSTPTTTVDHGKENKIKQLCRAILSPKNHIFTWGNLTEKLSVFYRYQLFNSNDLDLVYAYDIHDYFAFWYPCVYPNSMLLRRRQEQQPQFRRDDQKYTLQTAIFLVFNQWLDTRMKYAVWTCGMDTSLKTWYSSSSSSSSSSPIESVYKYRYLRQEIEYRQRMETYALYNCFATTQLMLHLCQHWSLINNNTLVRSSVIHYKKKKRRQTDV